MVYLTPDQFVANVWYSEPNNEWHWCLVWSEHPKGRNQMHHGIAPSRLHARTDIAKTVMWIEETWPHEEYFAGV